ncbi:MAG: hypothetical protein WC967_14670 [Balneolaceae bacterium]
MITGITHSTSSKQEYEVTNPLGQSVFPLTEQLTEDALVFVGGVLTDLPYTGVGTNTLTFTGGALNQGEIVTIKQ